MIKRIRIITVCLLFLFLACGLVEAIPIITIDSPENTTYIETGPTSLDLNWSIDTTVYDAKYSLNGGTNISLMKIVSNDNIVSGLTWGSDRTTPTVFQKDGTWYMISGQHAGDDFRGFNWTGTAWQTDNNIVNGLTIGGIVTYFTPEVFQKDGIWYLISGHYDGVDAPYGFSWTGTAWQQNDSIISGILYRTQFSSTVFQKDGTWYLLAGYSNQDYLGYSWTGSTWQSSSINAGAVYMGYYSKPEAFQKDGTWYLISGTHDGTFKSKSWTGSSWQNHNYILSGLGDIGSYSAPTVFQKDNIWYLISGSEAGNYYGYNWNTSNTTFTAQEGPNNLTLWVNDTNGNINQTTVYFVVGGLYSVDVINESDFTTPLFSDITVTNGTTTLNYDNVTSTSFNTAEIIGDITITATATNGLFEPRSFEDTLTFGENKSHIIYLPLTSTGSYINLNIQDALGLEINGAIVTTSKRNGGTYTEIDQATTDETGAIIVFMETGVSHKIDVTKTGYLDKTQYITATLSSYDITLSQSTTHLNDTTELAGLTIYQTPSQTVLRENDAEEFVVKITSNSTLDWWSVNYLQDGISISGLTNYTADSNGGTNVTTLNTTNRNGTIVSRIQYQVDGYGPRTFETNYTIYKIDDSDFSLKNIITGIDAKDYGNYGGMVVGFLALIITILIMATIGFEYPLTTLIGMIVLGFFACMAWLDVNIYFLALIGILAYLFIRRSV